MVHCGVEGVDGCAVLSVSSVLRVGRKERVRRNGDLSGVLADPPQVVAPWATDLSLGDSSTMLKSRPRCWMSFAFVARLTDGIVLLMLFYLAPLRSHAGY